MSYGDMKSRIIREVVRDDLATETAEAIQTGISLWEGQRFWFNAGRLRLTTVAAQEYYPFASSLTDSSGAALATGEGLLEIDSFTVSYNNQAHVLTARTPQWLDEMQSPAAVTTGQPNDYGIYDDAIRLHPIPDRAYTCTILGLKKLSTLAADADTNAWVTHAEPLIRNQAKIILYRDIVRDADGVALASAAMAEALAMLERKSGAKSVGRIRAWDL